MGGREFLVSFLVAQQRLTGTIFSAVGLSAGLVIMDLKVVGSNPIVYAFFLTYFFLVSVFLKILPIRLKRIFRVMLRLHFYVDILPVKQKLNL